MDARESNRATALRLLPPDAAKAFIRDKLGINNFDDRFATEKKTLLYEIMVAWQAKIPTQTITTLSIPEQERTLPTLEQNIQYMLDLEGGRCWTLHTSLHILLTSLGYDVMLLVGCVFNKDSRNHVIVVANDVTGPGSKHIAEVSLLVLCTIRIRFEAINLWHIIN